MKHESDGDTDCNRCARYNHQKYRHRDWRIGNMRTSGEHPNDRFIKIIQNTEKSPGGLKRLAVTQTPVGNYQLTLVRKTLRVVAVAQYPIKNHAKINKLTKVWFLCLMAYQPSWVISCQIHHSRRTVVVLFNP